MRTITIAATAGFLLAFGCGVAQAASSAAPVIDRISAGPDGGWDYATFDAPHQKIYVARTSGVTVIDLATKTSSAILPELSRNHIALPVNGGKSLLVTVGSTGEAVLVDLASRQITERLKTGSKPDAAMIEPVSGLVWVMDNKGGGITLIDPHSGQIKGKIAVEGALEFAVTDGAGTVFVNVEDHNEVIVLDAKSQSIRAHYAMPGCDEPTGLAFDAKQKRLIDSCGNHVAAILSAKSGKLLATVPIGTGPDAVVFDQKTDRALVPNGRDGTVTVIDMATMKVFKTLQTAVSARTATFDTETGALYLPSGTFAQATVKGAPPQFVPGSFAVLKIVTR